MSSQPSKESDGPHFYVQRKRCSTCIFNPHAAVMLPKLLDEIRDDHLTGHFKGHRICHKSHVACCNGFWEAHKDDFTMGQVAQRMGWVTLVQDESNE